MIYHNYNDWERRDPDRMDPAPVMVFQGEEVSLLQGVYDERGYPIRRSSPVKFSDKEILTEADKAEIEKHGKPEYEPLDTINAAKLYDMQLPPVYWCVNGLISEGITFLSAKSKVGKSWLCLQLAYAVSNGRDFLGFKTNKSKVIYMSLEDSDNRLQSRLRICFGADVLHDVEITTKGVKFNELIGRLEATLQSDPGYKLIMIDTYQKIKPDRNKAQSDYEHDYKVISAFQKLAFQYHVAILFTHHNRKSCFIGKDDSDPFDDLLGSTALQGACDNMLVIKINRKKSEDVAKLYTTSKDADNNTLAIKFNKQRCRWENYGDAEAYENMQLIDKYESDPVVKFIKEMVTTYGTYKTTIRDLRNHFMDSKKTVVGSSERELGHILKSYDVLFYNDGIRHTSKQTTKDGVKGLFHTFKQIEV